MTANFELPATLKHAVAGLAFTGKPLWNLLEGRRNMRIDIMLLLQDSYQQQTNKRARAVRKPAAKPTKKPSPMKQPTPA